MLVKYLLVLMIISSLLDYHLTPAQSQTCIQERMKKIKDRLGKIQFQSFVKHLSASDIKVMNETQRLAEKGIVNKGFLSDEAIQRQLFKAIHGEHVILYIFGESVSVGADLGRKNNEIVFHNMLYNWWNSLFDDITGSKMMRFNLAVGGVASSYFARCWEDYLPRNASFDIAIWEFNINDNGDESLSFSLELFTRKLYQRFKRLDLIFTLFYERGLFKHAKKHDISETLVANHARYYNLTCLDIEPLLNHSKLSLGKEDMFQKMHPSALAHSQMAFLMIDYYTKVMMKTLDDWLTYNDTLPVPSTNISLPRIQNEFSDDVLNHDATCWTAVTPDYRDVYAIKHSIFELPGIIPKEFINITKGWTDVPEERYDNTGGYLTNKKGAQLSLFFEIHGNYTHNVSVALRHFSEESKTSFTLQRKSLKDDSKQKNNSKSIKAPPNDDGLNVYPIAEVGSGEWNLTVKVETGDLLLCAIIAQ